MLMTIDKLQASDAIPADPIHDASTDPDCAAQILSRDLRTKLRIDPRGDGPFSFSSWALGLKDLRVVTASLTASRMVGGQSDLPTIILPLEGSLLGLRGRKEFRCETGETAILLPASCARNAECDADFRAVCISFVPERLDRTIHAMLGLQSSDQSAEPGLIRYHEARELPLRYDGHDIMGVFLRLFATLGDLKKIPNFLANSGMEECLYRAIALLLLPERLIEANNLTVSGEEPSYRLDRVCEFIRANLSEGLTLPDLENFSGLSARALQYSFRKAFGMTPMQWIQEQKLLAVRSALCKPAPGTTVTGAALPYFGSMGEFSRRYRARFGELPSATLARAKF